MVRSPHEEACAPQRMPEISRARQTASAIGRAFVGFCPTELLSQAPLPRPFRPRRRPSPRRGRMAPAALAPQSTGGNWSMIPVKPDIAAKAHIKSLEQYQEMYRTSIEQPEEF